MGFLGLIGVVLLNLAVVPQLIKIHKEKKARGMSWGYVQTLLLAFFIMDIYSVTIKSLPFFINYTFQLYAFGYIAYIKIKNRE